MEKTKTISSVSFNDIIYTICKSAEKILGESGRVIMRETGKRLYRNIKKSWKPKSKDPIEGAKELIDHIQQRWQGYVSKIDLRLKKDIIETEFYDLVDFEASNKLLKEKCLVLPNYLQSLIMAFFEDHDIKVAFLEGIPKPKQKGVIAKMRVLNPKQLRKRGKK